MPNFRTSETTNNHHFVEMFIFKGQNVKITLWHYKKFNSFLEPT
jgi:hypothetical protein